MLNITGTIPKVCYEPEVIIACILTNLIPIVLVLLLRLRQVCSHPSLIQEDGIGYFDAGEGGGEREEHARQAELVRAEQLLGKSFVERMQAMFRQAMLDRIAAEKQVSRVATNNQIQTHTCPVCQCRPGRRRC
jgi:hypothetical protein